MQKKPQKSLKKPQKAKKRPKFLKKPKKPEKAPKKSEKSLKKAEKSPKFQNSQKSPKKPEFFWVIQFRIVQNELWCTWAFFVLRQ